MRQCNSTSVERSGVGGGAESPYGEECGQERGSLEGVDVGSGGAAHVPDGGAVTRKRRWLPLEDEGEAVGGSGGSTVRV